MIDDFLTSPRDLPSLRFCRTTTRSDTSSHATEASESAGAFAKGLLLAAAMIGLPSEASDDGNGAPLSKQADGASSTR